MKSEEGRLRNKDCEQLYMFLNYNGVARYLSPPGKDMNPQEKSPADGPLPQWFHEGMAGKQSDCLPILYPCLCDTAVMNFIY